jgi:hypothetical protein
MVYICSNICRDGKRVKPAMMIQRRYFAASCQSAFDGACYLDNPAPGVPKSASGLIASPAPIVFDDGSGFDAVN